MVINNFIIIGITIFPVKTDLILPIYANAPLIKTIAR